MVREVCISSHNTIKQRLLKSSDIELNQGFNLKPIEHVTTLLSWLLGMPWQVAKSKYTLCSAFLYCLHPLFCLYKCLQLLSHDMLILFITHLIQWLSFVSHSTPKTSGSLALIFLESNPQFSQTKCPSNW